MPLPVDLRDAHIILVYRGNICVQLTVYAAALPFLAPPRLALDAARLVLTQQDEFPGRADFPIVPGDKPFGLARMDSDYVLDPVVSVGDQLADYWEMKDVEFIDPSTGKVESALFPTVKLKLDDIER